MKKLNLLPKLATPVQRSAISSVRSQANSGVALSHCDMATHECFDSPFPFAGDSAE